MFRWLGFNLRWITAVSATGLLSLAAYVVAGKDTQTENSPLPGADTHMRDLSWFIGEWTLKSRMLVDAAKDEWQEEDLYAVHTYEMGGHLIFEHFFGPLSGKPFEAWSLRSYNTSRGKWEQRWIDTGPAGFAQWLGSWADGQYIGYAERFLDADGNIKDKTAYREVFDNISEDEFKWRYEMTENGGETWKVSWTLDYVRAKSE